MAPHSAIAAHEVKVDSQLGEVTCESGCTGIEDSMTREKILEAHPLDDETGDWWRFELRRMRGAEEALHAENRRLTLENLN